MIRFGEIMEIDPTRGLARVRLADHDGLATWWLKVLQPKTLHDKAYWMPDIGEHVACMLDAKGEEGVILGAVYSSADATPETDPEIRRIVHKDGAVEAYDRAGHHWTLDVPAGGSITVRIGRTSLVLTDAETVLTTPQFRGVKAE
jgi:phage baseplate assembly protein V